MNLEMSLNNLPTYRQGSDILIPITLGSTLNPKPVSSFIDYEFEIIGKDDFDSFTLITFKKNPGLKDLSIITVDDQLGRLNLVIPKEISKEARRGCYYLLPTLVINTAANGELNQDDFTDKSGELFPAFNINSDD